MTDVSGEQPGKKSGTGVLPQDLSDFLIEFSIALHKHAMYPEGHPLLEPAVESVLDRLDILLQTKNQLSVGVANKQLVIEGVATDPQNPLLSELAGRLHRHHLGAMLFGKGATLEEFQDMLSRLAEEADRAEVPLGLGPQEVLSVWPHVRLYPMIFDRLELVDDTFMTDGEKKDETEADRRSTALWVGLAQAAMARDRSQGVGTETEKQVDETDPTVVANAINERAGAAAYDQVVVGYLLQIAGELKGTGKTEGVGLRRRMSTLVGGLSGETLERLLQMGGNGPQRKEFLLNAAEGMTADAVIDLVEAAGKCEGAGCSNSMLRILQKMAHHAENDGGKRQSESDKSLRDQVKTLVADWTLKDPNPGAYSDALRKMAESDRSEAVSPQQVFRPESKRLLQMALEVDTSGPGVSRAVNDLLEEGELKWVLTTLETADDSTVKAMIWYEITRAEVVRRMLEREPIDTEALDLMLPKLGAGAAEAMLKVLAESNSSQTRRVLLDRVVKLGPEIGQLILKFLDDERWFVQRNMLALLSHLPSLPNGFKGDAFMQHADPRVRREVFLMLFNDPVQRDRAISKAVVDSDRRTVKLGLTAALTDCPASAIPLVVARSTDAEDIDARIAAIRVLGHASNPTAEQALLNMIAVKKSLIRRKRPPKTPEYLAALEALHSYSANPQVKAALTVLSRSRDPEIAAAAASAGATALARPDVGTD